jgi:serine/threonine-protein kinase
MAPAPADRYQSARSLAQDLERFLADESVTAHRDTAVQRLGRWARHNRAAFRAIVVSAAALIVCGLSLAYSVPLYYQTVEAQQQRQAAVAARLDAEAQRHKAEQLAEEKTRLAEEKSLLADREREQRERADLLVQAETEFLRGIFQTADPIGMEGIDFFIPKEDRETLTAGEILQRGAQLLRDERKLDGQPLARAALLDAVGNSNRQIGNFDEAEVLLKEALALRENHLPPGHRDIAESQFHLGWCYHEMGHFPAARPLYEQALAAPSRHRTPQGRRQSAAVLRNMGWMAANEGESEAAERLFGQTIALLNVPGGPPSKDLGMARFGLAICLIDQEKYLPAIPAALFASYEWFSAEQNDSFREAADAFCWGMFYRQTPFTLGLSEARLRHSLKTYAAAAGPNHYICGVIGFELARTLRQAGKDDEAEREFRAALKIGRDKVHLEHPRILVFMQEFPEFLAERGQLEEAKALWVEFVQAQERRFKDHDYVARARLQHAQFLRWHGDLPAATDEINRCVAICRGGAKIDPVLTAHALAELGLCQLQSGRDYDAAAQTLAEAARQMDGMTSRFDDVPGNRLVALTHLAQCQAALGERDKADQQFQAILEALENYTGRSDQRRYLTDYVLVRQARFLRGIRDVKRAAAASLARRQACAGNARELVEVGGELADCIRLLGESPGTEQPQPREALVREAIATLAQALAAGHRDKEGFAKSPRLAVLREEPEFQKLLQEAQP